MFKLRKIRDQKGGAVTGLVIALMFFILFVGLFCFDAARVQMAQRELTATCDAAALAGTAMLTSYDVSNDTGPPASSVPAGQKLLDAQNFSGAYSYNMFLMGNILGRWIRPQTTLVTTVDQLGFTSGTITTGYVQSGGDPDGMTKVCIGLVDPQNGYSSVPPVIPANQAGTAIGVYAGYNYRPAFLAYLGIPCVGIRAASVGGLPQVDAVLVLDLSGSMDDLTPVTLVKRYWDAHRGQQALLPNGQTVFYGEPDPTRGYNGPANDLLNWSDDPTVSLPRINQLFGGSAYTDLRSDDFGSQPAWASTVNGTPEKNGQPDGPRNPDFDEFSGHGCVTYLEAPHPNTNQSIIEYVGLDTATYLTGTSLNALPPQNLQFSEKGTVTAGNLTLVFKQYLRHSPDKDDYGSPPGNCPLLRNGSTLSDMAMTGAGFGWIISPPGPDGRCSPYKNYLTDAFHYPPAPASGMYGTPAGNTAPDAPNMAYQTNAAIFTDLVVNFGNPGNGLKPVQPAWGPNIFQPVNYTFPGSSLEDDSVIQSQNYNFPNIATLVEASRGNLETVSIFQRTGLHRGYDLWGGEPTQTGYHNPNSTGMNSNSGFVSPQIGYQRAYQRLAMWYSQPIATTLDSCDQAFFQRLSALTDCRFGLVGFSDRWTISGNPPNSVASANTGEFGNTAYYTANGPSANSYYIDIGYQNLINNNSPVRVYDGRLGTTESECRAMHECRVDQSAGGGQGLGFRLPRFPLNTSLTKAQCLHAMQKGHPTDVHAWSSPDSGDGLYNGRPLNGTMCSEALETARLSFQTAPYTPRPGSKRAIVFFTDGVPVPDSEEAPSAGTADACKSDGVAIFSIGLNMLGNAQLTQKQTTFLGNGADGLSGRAKNGGRFFMCNDVTQVQQAFSSIARRLTQSQK